MPLPFGRSEPLFDRVEPRFTRDNDPVQDDRLFGDWSVPSATGLEINQQTAMSVAAVMACVSMLSEDFAKLTPSLYRKNPDGGRTAIDAEAHPVAQLLEAPNDWQTWYEFGQQMSAAFELRGNAYAVIVRDGRGRPVMLVPVNPDMVGLWESPDGSLFYYVTRTGMHMMAVLRGEPLLIPAADMLHVKGLSSNGLLGLSRISLNREAVALALGYEQQAARWMGQGGKPSGVLQTEQRLTTEAAKRMAQDWRDATQGILKTGRIAVLEQGLKFQALSLSANDLQFIASRTFQLQEIARMFRIPQHMIGELSRSTNNNVTQQSQEYVNFTISSKTTMWRQVWSKVFGLSAQKLFIGFDMMVLLEGDLITRFQANRLALSGWSSVNEVRLAEGKNPSPTPAADKIFRPTNMAPLDSDVFTAVALPGEGDPGIGSENGGENPGGGRPSPTVLNPDQEPS